MNILISKYFPEMDKIKNFEDIAPRRKTILAEFYKWLYWYVVEEEIDVCMTEYYKKTARYKTSEEEKENEFWGLWFNCAPIFIEEETEE